ncbi:MAG: prolyl-tRNA synthetase associated domain-containing protein [Promethearchaeota archaeon]
MDSEIALWLDKCHIQYKLYSHPAVYTVAEAQIHCSHIPGLACKNLFVKDSKKSIFYLITAPAKKTFRLNTVRKLIGATKLRFASPDELMDKLGLIPGAVSPLGLLNNSQKDVIYIIDQEIWGAEMTSFHPNTNEETLTFTLENFHKFVEAIKNEYKIIDLLEPTPSADK